MCDKEDPELRSWATDMKYYDEVTWKKLEPALVELEERAELERFKKMGVYEYVSRNEAVHDPERKVVKVKWARVHKGCDDQPDVR